MRYSRKLTGFLQVGALAALTVLGSGTPALAVQQGPFSMQVLVDGRPLDELAARGTTYVEALEGREYSIRLTNHTAGRIAVALSVDGLNSIDAKTTTAKNASKWILGPWDSIVIDGWQTSQDTARRFFFTTEETSYGAWLGKTSNLGVIAAAVFRERQPPGVKPYTKELRRDAGRLEGPRSQSVPRREAGQDAPSAAAPGDFEGQAEELSDDMAATGIGRELDHRVQRVQFRAEKSPAQVLTVRYEYRDALIALGVLPKPDPRLSRRERARGFSDSGFAPDPFVRPRR